MFNHHFDACAPVWHGRSPFDAFGCARSRELYPQCTSPHTRSWETLAELHTQSPIEFMSSCTDPQLKEITYILGHGRWETCHPGLCQGSTELQKSRRFPTQSHSIGPGVLRPLLFNQWVCHRLARDTSTWMLDLAEDLIRDIHQDQRMSNHFTEPWVSLGHAQPSSSLNPLTYICVILEEILTFVLM